jgi:hypothetical protein
VLDLELKAARRIAFFTTADGRIEPKPGPSWRRLKRVAGRLAGS